MNKVDTYRQMADTATASLTAQIRDWSRFLIMAGRFYKYGFHGINPEITLKPHQLGAIAHVLYGGNTLLAHEVGAGKTFEMIASAMEAKYLGLCTKSIFVVPNHLTQQTASEFLRLYPAANILVTTKGRGSAPFAIDTIYEHIR